jgi:arylsulfatase A-like enzyme
MSDVRSILVAVFDGLRADMIDPQRTPHLARFAARGTWFREARSVFPSMTRVATASIATGALPRMHGIVGNAFYFREAIGEHVLDASVMADIRRAEEATGGQFLTAPTFADHLAHAGRRVAVVHTGSAGSTYLINPRARANGHWTFTLSGPDASPTPEAVAEVVAKLGPLPKRTLPRFGEIDYATRVMLEHVLPTVRPDVALVWFNEPDTSFHYKFLGSAETTEVLRHVDAAFGRLLDWVEAQPDADRMAVIACSDHGQVSSTDYVPLYEHLSAAGHPTRRAAARTLEGAAITYTGGNMGEIRILEGGAARRDAVAAYLADHPAVGALYAPDRDGVHGVVPGSLSLRLVGLDHARQPDLVYILRSQETADPFGFPGQCHISGSDIPVGGGMHGGLNRFELNTTLIVSAPNLAAGIIDRRPAGIIDIAPTLLDLLDVAPRTPMDGASLCAPPPATSILTHETGMGGRKHGLTIHAAGRRLIIEAGSQT